MITALAPAALVVSVSETNHFAEFDVPLWAWVALLAVITALLMIDLLVVHRTPHEISLKEAGVESAIWIAIGLVVHVRDVRLAGRRRRPASTSPATSSRRASRSTTSSSGR